MHKGLPHEERKKTWLQGKKDCDCYILIRPTSRSINCRRYWEIPYEYMEDAALPRMLLGTGTEAELIRSGFRRSADTNDCGHQLNVKPRPWLWSILPAAFKIQCEQTLISALWCQPDEADNEAGMHVFYMDSSLVGSSHSHAWVRWKLPLKFLLFSALTTCVFSWAAEPMFSFRLKFSSYREIQSICLVLNYSVLPGSWKKSSVLVIWKIMRSTFMICFKGKTKTSKLNRYQENSQRQKQNTPVHSYHCLQQLFDKQMPCYTQFCFPPA